MKRVFTYSAVLILAVVLLASCSESRKRATEKLNEMNEKAAELNTAVDDGLKQIESIDSVVRSGTEKIKEYDSIVKSSASKIDSVAKNKTKAWEELTSF